LTEYEVIFTHVTFPVRWFTVNVTYVNFFRNALQVTNQGSNPPAVLYLSDGGHIENLGILVLLKLRLPKIVSVEGGRTILDEDYAGSLLIALDMARKKLGCSFTGMDGRDITEDIRDNFVERSPGSQPRSYRSVTNYSDFHLFGKCAKATNMHLLTERAGRTAKYLTRGHGLWTNRSAVRTP